MIFTDHPAAGQPERERSRLRSRQPSAVGPWTAADAAGKGAPTLDQLGHFL